MAKWWARGAIAVVLVAALCVVGVGVVRRASAAATPQPFMFKMDLAGQPVGNLASCPGETLTFTQGTVLFHGNNVTTGSGSFMGTLLVETHGLATGDISGTKYTVSANDNSKYISGPGQEFDEVYDLHVNGPGPDNNGVVTLTTHLTVDANGVIRVNSNTFSETCR